MSQLKTRAPRVRFTAKFATWKCVILVVINIPRETMLNYTLYEKHHPIPSYPVLGERFPQITVGAVVLYYKMCFLWWKQTWHDKDMFPRELMRYDGTRYAC